MRRKPNMLVVAGILAIPSAAVLAGLIYVCWAIVSSLPTVLELISRSL